MKLKITLIFCAIFYQFSLAQKSAPVAGDAAQLIDLLKKDYSTLDPENKERDLNRDRAIVISIFKSYLENTTSAITLADQTTSLDSIKSSQIQIKILENELNSLLQINSKTTTVSKVINHNNDIIKDIYPEIITQKKTISHNNYLIHSAEIDVIAGQYANNDYLKYTIQTFKDKYEKLNKDQTDLLAEVNHQSSIQKALPFFGGGFDINTLVDGLAQFLAERIKAELTNYVMQNIKNKLELENIPEESLLNELLVLLPKTADYINQFNAEEVLQFTDRFRAHIEADINNLLFNAANLKTTPRFKKIVQKNPDLEFAFEALEIIPQLSKIEHPVDYFDMLENSKTISRWTTDANATKHNIANTIKLATLLAHSLTVLDNNQLKFVSTRFMSNYASEPEFFLLYIGFLHQQNGKYYSIDFLKNTKNTYSLQLDNFMTAITPAEVIKGNATIKSITHSLYNITSNAEKLYQDALAIKKISKDDDKKVSVETINSFTSSFISFFEDTINTTQTILEQGENTNLLYNEDLKISTHISNVKNNLLPYIETAKLANNIVLKLHNKKYGLAIEDAMTIPTKFTDKDIYSVKVLYLANQIQNIEQFNHYKKLFSDFNTDTYNHTPQNISDRKKVLTPNRK